MEFDDLLPREADVVVVGGGIHGIGTLHDLASRGIKNCVLLEKGRIGAATSSSSTKLIHGGLRYLERIADFPMVYGALHERQLLMQLAPDLVTPIELILPILHGEGFPTWKIKAGLSLYDTLAGRDNIAPHRTVDAAYVSAKATILNQEKFKRYFAFWDAQTDDCSLVYRVAASAKLLGGAVLEEAQVLKFFPNTYGGWDVDIRYQDAAHRISAKALILCTGPWTGGLLKENGLSTSTEGLNNKGIHLLVKDLGLKSGLFLQSISDHRIFFVLPWMGMTLIGTTESEYSADPNMLRVESLEIANILSHTNEYLSQPIRESDIKAVFAGLRWLPKAPKTRNISAISRESVIEEIRDGQSCALTIYGGKLTTYRTLCQKLGDRVTKLLNKSAMPSRTHLPEFWAKSHRSTPSWQERFGTYGT